ncbi:MAG: c-type cytochrome [Thiotrichaceae bacterium]|nr:c-type cytochrome [Thiotrichaceae bacterium]
MNYQSRFLTSKVIASAALLVCSIASNTFAASTSFEAQAADERTKPVGQVNIGSAPVAAVAAAPKSGKEVFDGVCTACHTAGVMNAPKFGDKASWEPRIAKGEETLVKNAIKGLNAMPPKGGNPNLSDDEIKATVEYMLSSVK